MLVGHLFKHLIFSKRAGSLVRRIAWLSMIGISVSVTAFLVVLFVMNGMNASIRERILGLEPHLYVQVSDFSKADVLETHPVMLRLKEDPENEAYVYESHDVILRSQDGQFRGAIARGVTEESLSHLLVQLKQSQSKFNANPLSNYWEPADLPGDGEVIIGTDLAQALGVFEGDFLTVVSPMGLLLPPGEAPKFERVRVKRTVTTSLPDVDSQVIFYQRGKALSGLSGEELKKTGIEVWIKNQDKLESLKEDLIKFQGVGVETWKDRNSALLYALKLEKLTIGIFLGIAGLIAASSILSVLALLLSQKRKDIAVLRTLGFSAKQTIYTFTLIGFMLASVGVLTGVVFGTSIGLYIHNNPINLLSSEVYYDASIPALVDYGLVVIVLVVSAIVTLIGSYLPARTVLDIQPSEVLRQ